MSIEAFPAKQSVTAATWRSATECFTPTLCPRELSGDRKSSFADGRGGGHGVSRS